MDQGIGYIPWDTKAKKYFARRFMELNIQWRLALRSCSEPLDLSAYSVLHNACIDAALLKRLSPHDTDLIAFLDGDTPLLDTATPEGLSAHDKDNSPWHEPLKDPGQRKYCGCVYCYANSSVSASQYPQTPGLR